MLRYIELKIMLTNDIIILLTFVFSLYILVSCNIVKTTVLERKDNMSSMRELFESMKIREKKEWERQHSTLFQADNTANLSQCRMYSRKSIVNGLTKISIEKGEVVEITDNFHLLGRVNTVVISDAPEYYFKAFQERDFISFSTICNTNVSRFKGKPFFLYDLIPNDIVHVFPMDANTNIYAMNVNHLTILPSLWITLEELERITYQFRAYNQVTARTKRQSTIIYPYAVAAFGEVDEKIQKIASAFELGIVLLHPDKNAVNYDGDMLYDWATISKASSFMEKQYGFSVDDLYFVY